MNVTTLKSPAKINLTLDILGKDERSGKHFVNTILYRDDQLFDEIELKPLPGLQNILYCLDQAVPIDETNTILRALRLLGITGWQITLKKNIPTQAGLGGGSSNAGVILKHFGWLKGIPEHQLQEMGKNIGSDVPFFVLDDNLAYCEGFGDQIVQSWTIPDLNIEYIKTGIAVSTTQAYAELDLDECGMNSAKTEALLRLCKDGALPRLHEYIHNDFEPSFFKKHPEWDRKDAALPRLNLCGSGGMMWRMVGREGFEPPKA